MVFDYLIAYITTPYGIISIVLGLLVLILASITDIQTREVPDMLNYGFLFIAIAARLVYSAVEGNPYLLLEGFFGFLVGLSFGSIMFYTGQWGGGDSKMLLGLGVLFGIPFQFDVLLFNSFFIAFLVNMLFAGSIFGMVWSAVLALRDRKRFAKAWHDALARSRIARFSFGVLAVIIVGLGIMTDVFWLFILMGILVFSIGYVYAFARAVERNSMVKRVKPSVLTEGDWIDKDVFYKGKRICGPKDLGITKKQIALLKRYKVRFVFVKSGIPFIPGFLLGFLLTLGVGNVLVYVMYML